MTRPVRGTAPRPSSRTARTGARARPRSPSAPTSRNDSVTPSGTPTSTKPMKSGTAEQEQNGVTIAEQRREHVPDRLALAGEDGARPLGGEEGPDDADDEDDEHQQQQDLRRVVEEERDALAEMRLRREARAPGTRAPPTAAAWRRRPRSTPRDRAPGARRSGPVDLRREYAFERRRRTARPAHPAALRARAASSRSFHEAVHTNQAPPRMHRHACDALEGRHGARACLPRQPAVHRLERGPREHDGGRVPQPVERDEQDAVRGRARAARAECAGRAAAP